MMNFEKESIVGGKEKSENQKKVLPFKGQKEARTEGSEK